MKKTKWMTMAAVATLTASLAFAAPHGGMRGGRHGRDGAQFGERMAAKLNLTDAQKQQVRDLNQSFRESNKAFFESARATRMQFREAKQAGDTAKLESLKPQMESLREQMKQLHEAQQQRVLSVLTPDQRAQWEALKAERQQRRQQHDGQRDEQRRNND